MLTSFIISAITCIALDWLALHPMPPRPPQPVVHQEAKK